MERRDSRVKNLSCIVLTLAVGLSISVYADMVPERLGTPEVHDGYRIARPLSILYVDTGNPACDDGGPGTMQLPFCTIQAGYDAAANGDEVRVMPGTYTECLYLYDFITQKGVSIVADAYANSSDSSATTIDGTGLSCVYPGGMDPASVVNLGGFGSRLEGFTVTGAAYSGIFGVGPVVITHNVVTGNDSNLGGGGVYVYTATCSYGDTVTEISNNEITNNTTEGRGGGISIVSGQLNTLGCATRGNASVIVDGNTITGNSADASGGGVLASTFTADNSLSARIVITSNTITGNSASSLQLLGPGGGIFGYTWGYGSESIQVLANTIASNSTLDYGGGASLWIDPYNNNASLDHEIVVADNTVTGNDAGSGGGGLDLFLRTEEFRDEQRAQMNVYGNTIAGNTLTVDRPDWTFGGGGVLVYNVSRNSNSSRIGILLEGNDVSDNSAFGFGGGISLFGDAVADPNNAGTGAQVSADFELRNNAITRNNASTDVSGWDGAGGGVFMLLETEGDAGSRVEMELNTIAFNTLDNMTLPGGGHFESFIAPDRQGNEGMTELVFDNSIVAANEGIGLGGPVPGQPGIITPGGSDNFYVLVSYNDLFGNTAGDIDGWIPLGPGNISADPLFVDPPNDVHLSSASPAIDAGDPMLVPEDGQVDIDGDPRVLDGNGDGSEVVDMGVDEYVRRTITVVIDIKPDSLINHVNPRSRGVIPVALLGSESMDVTTLDPASLRFGPLGAGTAHDLGKTGTLHGHLQDVNYDGFADLVTHYRTQATGLDCSDQTSLMTLTGQTFVGQEVEGSDWVETVGCPGSGRSGRLVQDDDSDLVRPQGIQSIEKR